MSSIKSWERPWSMEEMIENANNWSLAGDVALLNSLQQFADKLLEKTQTTDDNIANLTNNLERTNLELNIAQNRFQSLRNTQFIESRVYEDDETLPQIEIEQKKVEDKDEDHTDDIKAAITRGLDVLDRYFDTVEVSVSDSEEEDDELPNYILRPKDLYIDRPLPYVIGTDEWHQKWHVGLEDSSDDDDDDNDDNRSDTGKISDNYSETESESTDLQLTFDRSQVKSDTSSELDFSKRDLSTSSNKLIDQKSIISDSSSSEEVKTLPTNFAQQLAEKLDRVVGTTVQSEPEVNTRPIQKPPKTYSDVFFDEPPPLEDAPVVKTGLFSGGGGLFDDNDDDDDLWSSQSSQVPRQQLGGNKTNEQSGLFDQNDDDDIFNKKPQQTKVLPPAYQVKQQLPVYDEPPPVDERKKPIGGVSIFGGNNDLFNKNLLKRHLDRDEDKVEVINDDKAIGNDKKDDKVVEKPAKKISLFDDDDDDNDLFKDDLFSGNITSKKFTSNLFNDDDDDDLLVKKITKHESLEHPDDSNSINTVKSNDDSLKLFDTTSSTSNNDLFNDFPKENQNSNKKQDITSKLFDSDDDDLFKLKTDKFETNDEKQLKKPDISLFDPTPPLDTVEVNDDDDWETKPDDNDYHQTTNFPSKSLFDDDDDDIQTELQQNQPSISHHSLLDETPPLLSEENNRKPNINDKPTLINHSDNRNEVRKDIQTPPGKLKHNLNINVAALIPGAIAPLTKHREIPESPIRDDDDDNVVSPQIEVKSNEQLEDKEIVTSFDTTDHVEVLQSVTKDRAKLPLNRRPSTRRGRKAALTISSKDFKLRENDDDNDDNEKIEVKNDKVIIKEETNRKSDLLSETISSSNFDDLFEDVGEVRNGDQQKFEVKSDITTKSKVKIDDHSLKDDKGTNLIKTKGLFDDDDDDNQKFEVMIKEETNRKSDLFTQAKSSSDFDDLFKDIGEVRQVEQQTFEVKSDNTTKFEVKSDKTNKDEVRTNLTKTKGLFDDDDDDNDENSELFTTKKSIIPKKPTKSLFDDDDDDDIFKTTISHSKKPEIKVATERKLMKSSNTGGIKKLDHSQPNDDPLGILNSNEN